MPRGQWNALAAPPCPPRLVFSFRLTSCLSALFACLLVLCRCAFGVRPPLSAVSLDESAGGSRGERAEGRGTHSRWRGGIGGAQPHGTVQGERGRGCVGREAEGIGGVGERRRDVAWEEAEEKRKKGPRCTCLTVATSVQVAHLPTQNQGERRRTKTLLTTKGKRKAQQQECRLIFQPIGRSRQRYATQIRVNVMSRPV